MASNADLRLMLNAVLDIYDDLDDLYDDFWCHVRNIDYTKPIPQFDAQLITRSYAFFTQLEPLADEPIHEDLVREFVESMNLIVLEHEKNETLKKALAEAKEREVSRNDERKTEMALLIETLQMISLKQTEMEQESYRLKHENMLLKLSLDRKTDQLVACKKECDSLAEAVSGYCKFLETSQLAIQETTLLLYRAKEKENTLITEHKAQVKRAQIESEQWANKMSIRVAELEEELEMCKGLKVSKRPEEVGMNMLQNIDTERMDIMFEE